MSEISTPKYVQIIYKQKGKSQNTSVQTIP